MIGVRFALVPGCIDERLRAESTPEETALRLAKAKAESVLSSLNKGIVIGADTLVDLDGMVLGKPENRNDASRMLNLLNGRRHRVLTALCLLDVKSGERRQGIEKTWVTFRQLGKDEIAWYLQTGEPYDKAGGYAIQGHGALLVGKIEGCYYNVVGLPVGLFLNMIYDMVKT
jgi:septum formation protein